jgi:hypothetical protein
VILGVRLILATGRMQGSGLGDQGDMDWGGFEEAGDLHGFAGFGGLEGVVFAGDDCGDGEHAVVGEARDFGFEVAGYHAAEFAEIEAGLAQGAFDDFAHYGGVVHD